MQSLRSYASLLNTSELNSVRNGKLQVANKKPLLEEKWPYLIQEPQAESSTLPWKQLRAVMHVMVLQKCNLSRESDPRKIPNDGPPHRFAHVC